MPIILTDFNNGDVVNAPDIEQRLRSVEKFVNGGTSVSDFASSWISTDLIVRPEFYGAPAPRMNGVSVDVHHREKPNNIEDAVIFFEDLSDVFIPIPGLAMTFHLPQAARIYVMCTFNTFEVGAHYKSRSPSTYLENKLVSTYRMFIDDSGIQSTDREAYANTDGSGSSSAAAGTDRLSRKQHSMLYHHTSTLAKGTHSVCVKMKINGDTNDTRKFGKIFVTRRNLIINAQYL
jgi:hypothetical protein